MVKNIVNVGRRFLFYKVNKNMQRKPGLHYFLHLPGTTSLVPNPKFRNFTKQNSVQSSFFMNLTKLRHRNRSGFLASGPF